MCLGELINPLVKLFSLHRSTGQSHTFTIIGLFEAISQQSIFSELLISARIVFIHVIFLSTVCFNYIFLCNFNTVFVSNFVNKYTVQYGFSQSGHLQPTTEKFCDKDYLSGQLNGHCVLPFTRPIQCTATALSHQRNQLKICC